MELIVALVLAWVVLDVRNERSCRKAVATRNANAPDDDPRKWTMYA